MKKRLLLVAAVVLSASLFFISCKETQKEEVKTESHEGHDHEAEEAKTAEVYQCPMDCEKGKVYENPGTCPVCKMDLKKKEVSEEELKNTVSCKCLQGEECICKPGECKCAENAEVASMEKGCGMKQAGGCKDSHNVADMQKDCKKCEPGKCECKA